MIRFVSRKLIIPVGDTGTFTIPLLANIPSENGVAVFSIFNLQKRIHQQEQHIKGDTITFRLEHDQTKDFPVGTYNWDVKIYTNPQYNEKGLLINGDQVNSYYAAFELPKCEVVPFSQKERG